MTRNLQRDCSNGNSRFAIRFAQGRLFGDDNQRGNGKGFTADASRRMLHGGRGWDIWLVGYCAVIGGFEEPVKN
jgi:hypothetical protein